MSLWAISTNVRVQVQESKTALLVSLHGRSVCTRAPWLWTFLSLCAPLMCVLPVQSKKFASAHLSIALAAHFLWRAHKPPMPTHAHPLLINYPTGVQPTHSYPAEENMLPWSERVRSSHHGQSFLHDKRYLVFLVGASPDFEWTCTLSRIRAVQIKRELIRVSCMQFDLLKARKPCWPSGNMIWLRPIWLLT